MNRIDRVTAILIQLQSKKIVKAQEIADRFSISLRTVYRDVKTLEEAGIPIIGEAGIGYSIMDGYRLPPVMFSREEATAFLTAEKLVEKFTDPALAATYQNAMFKIKAVLRSTEKDLLENMDESVAVHRKFTGPGASDTGGNLLPSLLKAVSEKKMIRIRYQAFNQSPTARQVEPIGLFYYGGYWHVIAWCQLRQDYRDFRTDRIASLTVTDTLITQSHPSLKAYLAKVKQEQDLKTVVINVQKEFTPYLQEQKYYNGFVSEKQQGEDVQMTFLTPCFEGFIRWYIMFADKAGIVKPRSLEQLLLKRMEEITQKLHTAAPLLT
ncbi:helix-turn-helix transcriptional regulator [Deminuibacter soli]|uniref:YafY family transcriptional regulator n=1 Tax=Deminuibacter soli TaxID=2291815 RepID=A0A3E1NK13_9BACT|nr:YafY family protein [Deminuibacter soli]RFM28275.1 YafY family transcriptional regulator [Deminuibacter soli]